MNSPELLKKIPTILFVFIAVGLMAAGLEPSSKRDILFLSYPAFSFLATLSVGCAYLIYSLFRSRLLRFNNAILCPVLISAIGSEVMLRAFPTLVPNVLLVDLPREAARHIADQRGFLTTNTMTGEGMLYHYKPNQVNSRWSYLQIDSQGYRNPDELPRNVDAVLLGDSMILAQESEVDLGALFRKHEMSVLNLAMGGYAPQHYRDAYRKLIVEKKIKNTRTIIFLFEGNDFDDALQYERTRNGDGKWEQYLQSPPTHKYQDYMPWIMNVVMGLPRYVSGRIENPTRVIKLPYMSVDTGYLWWPPAISPEDERWKLVRAALVDLTALSRSNSAVPILFLLPSPATLYSQFDAGLVEWDQHHQTTTKTILDFAKEQGIEFVDLNDPLRMEMQSQFILHSSRDCHFNALGVTKLFDLVSQRLSASRFGGSRTSQD